MNTTAHELKKRVNTLVKHFIRPFLEVQEVLHELDMVDGEVAQLEQKRTELQVTLSGLEQVIQERYDECDKEIHTIKLAAQEDSAKMRKDAVTFVDDLKQKEQKVIDSLIAKRANLEKETADFDKRLADLKTTFSNMQLDFNAQLEKRKAEWEVEKNQHRANLQSILEDIQRAEKEKEEVGFSLENLKSSLAEFKQRVTNVL